MDRGESNIEGTFEKEGEGVSNNQKNEEHELG